MFYKINDNLIVHKNQIESMCMREGFKNHLIIVKIKNNETEKVMFKFPDKINCVWKFNAILEDLNKGDAIC